MGKQALLCSQVFCFTVLFMLLPGCSASEFMFALLNCSSIFQCSDHFEFLVILYKISLADGVYTKVKHLSCFSHVVIKTKLPMISFDVTS